MYGETATPIPRRFNGLFMATLDSDSTMMRCLRNRVEHRYGCARGVDELGEGTAFWNTSWRRSPGYVLSVERCVQVKVDVKAAAAAYYLWRERLRPSLRSLPVDSGGRRTEIWNVFAAATRHTLIQYHRDEVGVVDVPNASVMLSEPAAEVWPAQAYQLGGRHWPGEHKSYLHFATSAKRKRLGKLPFRKGQRRLPKGRDQTGNCRRAILLGTARADCLRLKSVT